LGVCDFFSLNKFIQELKMKRMEIMTLIITWLRFVTNYLSLLLLLLN